MNLDRFAAQRDRLRSDYIGNECDTDEYRETQPEKGIDLILHLGHLLHEDPDRRQQLLALVETWVKEDLGEPYGGAEALQPICGLYFDVLWERGEHPYYGDEEEITQWLEDTADPEASASR
jgi:hypothetical protein